MADIKISELARLLNVEDTDDLVINDTSALTTKKISRERFLEGITRNVIDSGDNVIVQQDMTVNNELIVGGDIAATGDISFGTLTDYTNNIRILKFVDGADGIQNNDSDAFIPTARAVRSYIDFFLDSLYDSAVAPQFLNDLIDVELSSPSVNEVLKYNGIRWTNAVDSSPPFVFNDLLDVSITSPSTNDTIIFDGASWVSGSGGLSVRDDSLVVTTASLVNNDSADVVITNGYKGYALYTIETDQAAWVRVYTDSASRDADFGRVQGAAAGSGLVTEVVTSGAETINLAPAPIGFNASSPTTTNIPLKVVNLSGGNNPITVTLTALRLEI